jgi:hypothetical protein
MSDTLTTLTAKLQALLLDDGTIFASGTCTAAIRQALQELNLRLPVHAGTTIDAVTGQNEYELTTALAGAVPLLIMDVLLQDPSGAEYDRSLSFHSYNEDERHWIRLDLPQTTGQYLIVRFTQAHTISGLDSATESTLPAAYDPILLDGAAAMACDVAIAGKAEAYYLNPQTAANYKTAAGHFRSAFNFGIKAMLQIRRPQKSAPDLRTWEDDWHGWPN